MPFIRQCNDDKYESRQSVHPQKHHYDHLYSVFSSITLTVCGSNQGTFHAVREQRSVESLVMKNFFEAHRHKHGHNGWLCVS